MSLRDAIRKAVCELGRYQGQPWDEHTLGLLEEMIIVKLSGIKVSNVKIIPNLENRWEFTVNATLRWEGDQIALTPVVTGGTNGSESI